MLFFVFGWCRVGVGFDYRDDCCCVMIVVWSGVVIGWMLVKFRCV